jgi:hypothetical protein
VVDAGGAEDTAAEPDTPAEGAEAEASAAGEPAADDKA